jgi:hypothetical protein
MIKAEKRPLIRTLAANAVPVSMFVPSEQSHSKSVSIRAVPIKKRLTLKNHFPPSYGCGSDFILPPTSWKTPMRWFFERSISVKPV